MAEIAYSRVFAGSVANANRRLRSELEHRGFAIIASLTVNRFLERTGRSPVEPVMILEVGSPEYLAKALSISRQSALLLPWKFVISQEDGETLVTLQRPTIATHALLPIPSLVELNELAEHALEEAIDATVGPRLAVNEVPVFVVVDQTVRRWTPGIGIERPRGLGLARHGGGRRRTRPTVARGNGRSGRRSRRGSRGSRGPARVPAGRGTSRAPIHR